ncbi:hypothetical protein B0H17DRAFT_1127988 [Mycena rosella]|uniref:Uncharacterized protein n=1 Tax=Mycena rosella TaxID=1033263 RepID=A0AAD7DWW3_MYCRO|nr:hypothetical protein B0H17DRAFT_1127988 [Mycena rosella]
MAFKTHPEISATNTFYYALTYVPFCLGMKSMIMTIDDLLDYDIAALVERTKDRALPRGAISLERARRMPGVQNVKQYCYVASNLSARQALYVDDRVALYIIYPTCKRWTNLASIPLCRRVPWNVLAPVYLGACLWTITYETIYQHQDKIDDIKIGINSPALLYRRYTIPICTMTALGFLCLLAYGGMLHGQGISFYVGVVLGGIILVKTVVTADIDCPAQCKAMFLTTPLVGQIVLVGFVVDTVVHRPNLHQNFDPPFDWLFDCAAARGVLIATFFLFGHRQPVGCSSLITGIGVKSGIRIDRSYAWCLENRNINIRQGKLSYRFRGLFEDVRVVEICRLRRKNSKRMSWYSATKFWTAITERRSFDNGPEIMSPGELLRM